MVRDLYDYIYHINSVKLQINKKSYKHITEIRSCQDIRFIFPSILSENPRTG
jgi:hypothetical protein